MGDSMRSGLCGVSVSSRAGEGSKLARRVSAIATKGDIRDSTREENLHLKTGVDKCEIGGGWGCSWTVEDGVLHMFHTVNRRSS